MPTRVPNPLHRIYDDLQAAINEITTLNGGEIPFANTKPGLVVGLLTNVLNAIKGLLTSPTPSMTVEQVSGLTEQLAAASSVVNEMLRSVSRTMRDSGSMAFRKAMDACQSNIIGAGALIEELVVPVAIKRERPDDDDDDPDADESGIIDRTRKPPRDRRQIDDDDEEAARRRREREAEQIGDPGTRHGPGWQCSPVPAPVTTGTGQAATGQAAFAPAEA